MYKGVDIKFLPRGASKTKTSLPFRPEKCLMARNGGVHGFGLDIGPPTPLWIAWRIFREMSCCRFPWIQSGVIWANSLPDLPNQTKKGPIREPAPERGLDSECLPLGKNQEKHSEFTDIGAFLEAGGFL